MVRLREISRTAAFAWSPGATKPLIVTGTRAGAVDADFSDETKLELWDLSLDSQEQGLELQPISSIVADSRFYDIAWGPPIEDYPCGIIAGALENGSLDLWDAEKLVAGDSDALVGRTTKHTGAIKSLQFNPLKPQILATAGAKGELFVYDVNDPSNAFRLGTATARADDLECVAWNRKVSHILATGGSGGFVTVWDLKTKKASLTLNNNRKAVSSIAWDPNNSTKLLTATPDDNSPDIMLWDLRNSNAPERTLKGHEQGVLSISWCEQDADLVLSCGKDNRTLVWNPQTGEKYGEFPEVTNWTFSTRFHPHYPHLSATAAFDGKVTIQTLQNTNPSATQTTTQNNLDGEDFFTQAQTQPQEASFSLLKAPKWMQPPVGACFGFGGKLVYFKHVPTQPGHPSASKIAITQVSVDSDIGTATEKFEEALESGDLAAICASHKEQAKTEEEKAEWTVMETLLAADPRRKIAEYLGFSQEEEEEVTNGVTEQSAEAKEDKPEKLAAEKGHKKNRLSMFFSDGAEDGDDFLASLSATKGAKTDNPFHLFGESDSAAEKQITKALMLGQFEKATRICLKENRMADAFMIANCGGKDLLDQVQSAYLSQKTGMPSYLRLLSSVIVKNLWDVVYNADLAGWKETIATLCTFADPTEFPDLCEALGDRIFESGSRQDASFCFLIGHKLEKVVNIWIAELEEAEQAGMKEANDSTFSIHARSLQQFIEKVTLFREVAKFNDTEQSFSSGWKLSALYDKYTEYADIVAAHGQLSVAQKYLDLLPTTYPAAEVARNRIRQATQKTAPKQMQQPAVQPRGSSRAQPMAYQTPQAAPAMNTYAPPAMQTQPANAYMPPGMPQTTASSSAYAPAGYAPAGYQRPVPQPMQSMGYQTPTPAYGAPPQNFGAPPRNSTPSGPRPSRALKDVGNWNDVPIVTKAPPRRQTPSMAPITAPFPGQANAGVAPPPSRGGNGTPPPPPPKGPAMGRVTSPLTGPPQVGTLPPPPRPASTTNPYAPAPSAQGPPTVGASMPPPPPMANIVPRTASPYNPAPANGPPSNRYAPAPAAPGSQPKQPSMAPPSGNRPPPSANPYAPAPQSMPPAQSPYAPSSYAAPPPQGPQQTGPSPTGPPMGGPPMAAKSPAPPSPAPPAKAKHPAGDRSHIPPSAMAMVDIFTRDMQRVAAKAPASFAPQVKDTQKRINILFDCLNNEELVKPDTIEQLNQLANALDTKDFAEAQRLQVEIQRDKTEECGNWMVGVKRLITMSKATA